MKLTTVLILGAAGTAAYLFLTRQGTRSGPQPSRPAAAGGTQTTGAVPATWLQALKRTVTGRRRDGTPLAVRADPAAANDVALARQVEATLALHPHVTTGRVLVSADGGRITLRGTTDVAAEITAFEQSARAVPGVADVQNLLHIQGTAAPTRHRQGLDTGAIEQAFTASDH
jgi:BON domain